MSRSEWFRGFLYAEAVYKGYAPNYKEAEQEVDTFTDVASYFGDFSDFDRGAQAYTILMRERDEKLR